MDNILAIELAARGWVTVEDLAEQSVDELMEIEGMEEQRAAALIMKAREPWFAKVQEK
jgi:N utilization substance protein A